MNICFRIKGGDAAKKAFLEEGVVLGLTRLKGHRDLRGIRVGNYNSVPPEGIEKLAKFVDAFASQWGISIDWRVTILTMNPVRYLLRPVTSYSVT
ncbi:hypothetical protein HD806DRAFT_497333 [Xylariaceae sp. AK1471]|nr:hypothetical protein HD806DRAFT_497333 [Xylariaceae sp. AK1471]